MNNTHSHSNNLGVFGWNLSSITDVKLTTDSNDNIYIYNLGIETLLPSQQAGTALYNTADSETPLGELISNPYRLNSQQFIQPYSAGKRIFTKQADGSYQGSGTLTRKTNHYELEEASGNKIVFRPDGQLNYVEDSNGYRLTAGYSNGVVNKLSASNGDSFTFAYNSDGRIKTVTDARGQVDTYSYDATGQYLLNVEDANGTTSFSYNNPFDPTLVSSVTYDDGLKVSYDYDHAGRLQQVIYGEGREALATTYSYDDNGGVTVTNPDGGTNSEIRNLEGQVSQTIDANGRVTNYSYDATGNLTGISSELGYSAGFTYDNKGNVVSQTNALNETTQFTYDAQTNNLTGFKDARGNDVLYSYDSRGNLSQITYEDGTTDKYVYNADGLLTKSTNRRGQEIAYEYNDNYQITKETHGDGRIIEYEYRAATGLLTSIRDNNREDSTQFSFNQTENRFSIIHPGGLVHSYIFDNLGRKTQITIQNGTTTYTTNYSYDNLGRLDKLTNGNGNLIIDYDYHPVSGQLAKETNGNGTYTSYSYDLAGQLVSLVNSQADGTINSRFDYIYDNLGRRTEVGTLDGTWKYEYDLSGQLTGAVFASTNADIESQDLTYVYDAAGNRTQTIVNGVTENYSTNNLNQYENAGTTTYSYDLDGNLTSKTEGGQTWTYSYNDDNRLVEVVDGDNNLTQYEYDAFGNRTVTIYNGQRTEYLIDPFGYGDVIAEYDDDGNLIGRYDHGIGLVSRTDANNNQSFYDFDGNGSTAALTGQAGTELNSYAYRPFGEDFYEVETVDNSFEYVGQWGITEEANGLDFMRARYYDSHSGRFVASDPIGLQGQDSNFYRYVNNDPIGYIDPEGTIAFIASAVLISFGSAAGGIGTGLLLTCLGGQGGSAATNTLFLAALIAAGSGVPGGAQFGAGLKFGEYICNSGNSLAAPPPHAEDAQDGFEDAEQSGSPLVLDLDGDGIELTAVNTTNVFFDVDNDGFREATGWVQADDGLLVLDRNNDGYINDNSELFGNFTTSGFVELRAIDDNGDNYIDVNDSQFANLQVWRDLDSDGRSDVNELYSLAELNITGLNAVADNVNIVNAGNRIRETTFYRLADGTTRELADPWFEINQLHSYYDAHSTYNEPVVLNAEIFELPNLKGYGDLPDLRIAMAKDAELQALVKSFTDKVSSGDVAGGRDLVESILYRWAGVDAIDPTSRNANVDARKLRFLERFIGRNWRNSSDDNLSNPGANQGRNVEAVFSQLLSELEIRLLVQAADSPVDYNTVTESYVFPGSITEAGIQFKQLIAQSTATPSQKTELQAVSLAQYIRQEGEYPNWILGNIDSEQLTGSAEAEELYGFLGNDTLDAEDGDNLLDGGAGSDRLNAGEDNDTLYGGEGDDTLSAGHGINLLYAQSGDDSLVSGTGEDILHGDAGNDILRAGSGNDIYYGGSGNDLIEDIRYTYVWYEGYTNDSDTLDGGTGDDTLKGGGGDDVYIFDLGYGNDVISDYSYRGLAYQADQISSGGDSDTLVFGNGITRDSLRWNFDGKDLIFTFSDLPNDSLTIENYYSSIYRIENFQVEGSELTRLEIISSQTWRDTSQTNSLIWLESSISYRGLAGNDTITTGDYNDRLWGYDGNDSLTSGGGNDTVSGNNGNDSIEAGEGDDTVSGGNDNDSLGAGNGNNYLNGGNGNDSLFSGSGEDTLDGYTGDDTLKGGSGNDVYYGREGNDLIEDIRNNYIWYASYSFDSDTLDGGTGNDTLKGGGGDDVYIFNQGYGNDLISDYSFQGLAHSADRISDGGNNDTLSFGTGITLDNLRWNFDGVDLTFTLTNSTNDSLTIENYANSFYRIENIEVAGTQLSIVEILNLQSGRDTQELNSLRWLETAISFKGLDGNDTITTGDYNDRLWGNDGDDSLTSGEGDDILVGNAGNDTLDGGSGKDRLYIITDNQITLSDTQAVGEGTDSISNIEFANLYGKAGNNLIDAGSANLIRTIIKGNGGNDTLKGGQNNDTLVGGLGNDTLIGNEGNDVLDGGAGSDRLYVVKDNNIILTDTKVTGDGTDTISNIEFANLYGKSGNNYIDASGAKIIKTIIKGNGGNDTLRGGALGDRLEGGSGNDRINGGGGNDTVVVWANNNITLTDTKVTGDGTDTISNIESANLNGGDSNNYIDAENALNINAIIKGFGGNDTLRGGAKDDELHGGSGNDTIIGFGGDDTIDGGDGRDRLYVAVDNDITLSDTQVIGDGTDTISNIEYANLYGRAGNNLIDAGGATKISTVIKGYDGSDTLIGSQMSDNIFGGNGSDILYGGNGDDILIGNGGADVFVLQPAAGTDTIRDWSDGVDFFGLSEGMGFGDLSITNNQNRTATLIASSINGNQLLAIVNGVDASSITEADFTTI